MATVVKTFTWDASVESWVFTSGGKGVSDYNTSNGDPSNGCLGAYTLGRNNTDTSFWRLSSQTWEGLGVPAGATVTNVQVTDIRNYIGLTHFNTIDSSGILFTIKEPTGGTTIIDGVAYTRTGILTQDTAWVAGSGTQRGVLSGYQASNTPIQLELEYQLDVGNNGSAALSIHADYLQLTITYTTSSTVRNLTSSVSSATATSDVLGKTSRNLTSTVSTATATSDVIATVPNIYNHVVDPGGTGDFTSLQAWRGTWGPLSAAGDVFNVVCKRTTSAIDSTRVLINNFAAGCFINISVDDAYRHDGVWADTNALGNYIYRLVDSTALQAGSFFSSFGDITLDGLLISGINSSGWVAGINLNGVTSTTAVTTIKNCIIKNLGADDTYAKTGIYVSSCQHTVNIINCLVYDFKTTTNYSNNAALYSSSTALQAINIYNTLFENCFYDVKVSASPTLLHNCISQNNTNRFSGTAISSSSDHNISDTTGTPNATFSGDSITLVFADLAGEDYRLDAVQDTEAIDTGGDYSGVFTDDIIGDVRSGWSIGPFEEPYSSTVTRNLTTAVSITTVTSDVLGNTSRNLVSTVSIATATSDVLASTVSTRNLTTAVSTSTTTSDVLGVVSRNLTTSVSIATVTSDALASTVSDRNLTTSVSIVTLTSDVLGSVIHDLTTSVSIATLTSDVLASTVDTNDLTSTVSITTVTSDVLGNVSRNLTTSVATNTATSDVLASTVSTHNLTVSVSTTTITSDALGNVIRELVASVSITTSTSDVLASSAEALVAPWSDTYSFVSSVIDLVAPWSDTWEFSINAVSLSSSVSVGTLTSDVLAYTTSLGNLTVSVSVSTATSDALATSVATGVNIFDSTGLSGKVVYDRTKTVVITIRNDYTPS